MTCNCLLDDYFKVYKVIFYFYFISINFPVIRNVVRIPAGVNFPADWDETAEMVKVKEMGSVLFSTVAL